MIDGLQIQTVTADTDIVTITIGGNDIGFADLILQCTLADCSAALDNTRSTLASFLTPRLDTVYAAVDGQVADCVGRRSRLPADCSRASAVSGRSGSRRPSALKRTSSLMRSIN